ncbi:MAG: PilT/PilU family type 4a pilus ATPase [Candidatus Orphnella occulta]|nr:PilT/PilU family type 4a pilus ATPase [Candidatus Orphnella occulta]MDP8297572.1 PilT/PilU family type 4a pilus ATPase [Candidatus Orphnella occulta]
MEIIDLLHMAMDSKASDLILAVGVPPVLRVRGVIKATDLPVLMPDESKRIIYSMLDDEQRCVYEKKRNIDISYSVSGLARFRVNIHQQRGSIAAAIRTIPLKVPSLDELRLPKDIIVKLCNLRSGLVLVTGHSVSGKTTTLAAMIDYINSNRPSHIITIEDPIEFMHKHKKAVLEQLEIPIDSNSFAEALNHVMRQNPDIVMVGEIRDLETISAAITAAEAGQLVFATLPTLDASDTINRMIGAFSSENQQQIRVQLAATLQGIISQRLVNEAHGNGVIVACEIALGIPAVKNLIREGNTHHMLSVVETNAKHGMQSMDQALIDLYTKKVINKDELLSNIKDKEREVIKAIINE